MAETGKLSDAKTTQKLRLRVHDRKKDDSKKDEEERAHQFLYNRKDFLDFPPGSAVELKPIGRNARLVVLLQEIRDSDETLKSSVSIPKAALYVLNLRADAAVTGDVEVSKIDAASVTLEMMEVVIKDQYASRSDLYRMRKYLTTSEPLKAVYLRMDIEHSRLVVRVSEMWRGGERMASGLVNKDTRIVFRSASACMYMFIQMSEEMWQFGFDGQMYFEKFINEFLHELLQQWNEKDNRSSHYVTIVLVSRWFYESSALEEFPERMRPVVLQDKSGRFYQDFYRLVVQNENYDDWVPVQDTLKKLLTDYREHMARHFEKQEADFGVPIPKAVNSKASEGNFLETINMSLNAFVKQHIDRVFERTGQIVLFITPGTGVFVVDNALANLTKQRICDFGISLDMIILGDQPLHAVPLFVYQRAHEEVLEKAYNLPHWMSYSFYGPIKPHRWLDFVPQIQIPPDLCTKFCCGRPTTQCDTVATSSDENKINNERRLRTSAAEGVYLSETLPGGGLLGMTDGDEMPSDEQWDRFDSDVLALLRTPPSAPQPSPVTSAVPPERGYISEPTSPALTSDSRPPHPAGIGGTSVGGCGQRHPIMRSSSVAVPGAPGDTVSCSRSASIFHDEDFEEQRIIARSIENPAPLRNYVASRPSGTTAAGFQTTTVFNPFKPGETLVKITSNRRRWIDVFPTDSEGRAKQTHHYVFGTSTLRLKATRTRPTVEVETPRASTDVKLMGRASHRDSSQSGAAKKAALQQVWEWGVTGEEAWNPNIRIGMDWRSISKPALLPLTVDFFPDSTTLGQATKDKADYYFSSYDFDVDEEKVSKWSKFLGSKDWEDIASSAFEALVLQRLQMGCQIVTLPTEMLHNVMHRVMPMQVYLDVDEEYFFTFNRVYQRLLRRGCKITCQRFCPNRPHTISNVKYKYQLRIPDVTRYVESSTEFKYEPLDQIHWSAMDTFLLSRGQDDVEAFPTILDAMTNKLPRYLKSRFLVIPSNHPGMRRIMDDKRAHCDQFHSIFESETVAPFVLVDAFIRFMKTLNRIRRPLQKDAFCVKNSTLCKDQSHKLKASRNGGSSSDEKQLAAGSQPVELTTALPAKVVAAMKDPVKGLCLIADDRLPPLSLVSAELVHWLVDNVAEVNTIADAEKFAESLVTAGYLAPVKPLANSTAQFSYGFYLFYLSTPGKKVPPGPYGDIDWLQASISLQPPTATGVECPFALRANHADLADGCSLPLESSDPRDWLIIAHTGCYYPGMAFEVTLNWAQATGALMASFVSLLRRAATSCLHMVPVPLDPFAFSFNVNSDPLRSSIQVKLSSELTGHLSPTALGRLQLSLLKEFGFVSMACERHRRVKQFIHLSGAMFALIPHPPPNYVFVWSWNFMLSGRYRHKDYTGDTAFEDRVMADFRAFCNGDDDRLARFLRGFEAGEGS